MSRGRSKGKKRQHSQSPPPLSQLTQSHLEGETRRSQSSDGEDGIQQTRSAKRSRKSSPARVKSVALAKVMRKSSSSKGMAGFSALLNSSKLSAASTESTRGRTSRSSSGRAHAVGSNAEMDAPYSIGTIVFIVVGVELNTVIEPEGSLSFHPAYRPRSEVDISPVAVTGMIQSGLAVRRNSGFQFRPSDSYSVCDSTIRSHFPRLFHYIDERDDDDEVSESPWLVCFKPPYKKSLVVYSTDRIPTGFDIISSCQITKSKAGIGERTLYLITCDPVHQDVLRAWRPLIKTRKSVDVDVNSGDDTSSESHDDSKSTISEHTKKSSSSRSAIMAKSEDEVEQDIISVSSDEERSAKAANPPTPPHIEKIKNTFSMSFNLDDEENPWH